MNLSEAANKARSSNHGSFNHAEAMRVLYRAFREANPQNLNPDLETLWSWVDVQIGVKVWVWHQPQTEMETDGVVYEPIMKGFEDFGAAYVWAEQNGMNMKDGEAYLAFNNDVLGVPSVQRSEPKPERVERQFLDFAGVRVEVLEGEVTFEGTCEVQQHPLDGCLVAGDSEHVVFIAPGLVERIKAALGAGQ